MLKTTINKNKVVNLIEKIDKKKMELKQLKKELRTAPDFINASPRFQNTVKQIQKVVL